MLIAVYALLRLSPSHQNLTFENLDEVLQEFQNSIRLKLAPEEATPRTVTPANVTAASDVAAAPSVAADVPSNTSPISSHTTTPESHSQRFDPDRMPLAPPPALGSEGMSGRRDSGVSLCEYDL